MSDQPQALTLQVDGDTLSALLDVPTDARACYVFAHGAGAGMTHRSMQEVAQGLAQRGIATLRYNFAYMERGSKRTDAPPLAHAAVRAAVAHAGSVFASLPLFAGGKSFGGRMTSQAQSIEPLPGVKGLVFMGFPLHPAGQPSGTRAAHLHEVKLPMLFVQGTRDKLAEIERMQALVPTLGEHATLLPIAEADHSFHVLVRSARTDAQVLQELLDGAAAWMLRQQ